MQDKGIANCPSLPKEPGTHKFLWQVSFLQRYPFLLATAGKKACFPNLPQPQSISQRKSMVPGWDRVRCVEMQNRAPHPGSSGTCFWPGQRKERILFGFYRLLPEPCRVLLPLVTFSTLIPLLQSSLCFFLS